MKIMNDDFLLGHYLFHFLLILQSVFLSASIQNIGTNGYFFQSFFSRSLS